MIERAVFAARWLCLVATAWCLFSSACAFAATWFYVGSVEQASDRIRGREKVYLWGRAFVAGVVFLAAWWVLGGGR